MKIKEGDTVIIHEDKISYDSEGAVETKIC